MDLYGNWVIATFSGGIFEEPPSSPEQVLGGPDANYARCGFGMAAYIKTESTGNTADLDNVVYGTGIWCQTLVINGVASVTGKTGITRTITKVELCQYDTATRACGPVVSSAGPASASSGTTTLWALGEVETPFLTLNTLYAVRTTVSFSHPQGSFTAVPLIPVTNPGTLPCLGGGTSTLTCNVTSVPFRYYP